MAYSAELSGGFASIHDYFATRAALIDAEQQLGYEGHAKRTELEAAAEKVLQIQKASERDNLYGVHKDGSGCEAGHRFLYGHSLLKKSKVAELAFKAPKGCLLHCHFDAILPPDGMLSDAREQNHLYIKSDVPLIREGFFEHALPQFAVLKDHVPLSDTNNLFRPTYTPGSWMKYSSFLEMFPGGVERAESWLTRLNVLDATDAYHSKQTVDGIWQRFIRAVILGRSLLCYESAYAAHLRRIIWAFARDGVFYAEIRFAMNYQFVIKSDDGSHEYGHHEIMQLVSDVVKEEIPKIREAGLVFYGIKVIYACMRKATKEAMEWCMNTCIELKQAFPDLICGFDLQGQEDAGYPLRHWLPELLAMREKITALGLDLPFILHAGETHDHGGDTDSNLYDAILLGTKRIGHAFSITKHPLLMQLCKERNIAIETCPLSNEILGLCPTTKTHHLPVLLSNGVPCTINSDDPGSWSADVMSHDFYQSMMGSNNMSLLAWRVLAEWSIEHSCMDTEMKNQVGKEFNEEWIKFCTWILEGKETKTAN